jgi:hypothetical protein
MVSSFIFTSGCLSYMVVIFLIVMGFKRSLLLGLFLLILCCVLQRKKN